MSPAAARAARPAPRRPAPRSTTRPVGAPPRLRVLAPPVSVTWRPSFVAACAAILAASLLGVLVINIVLSRGAYEEKQLELRQIALTEREQALSERLAVESSPARLSSRAREMGMIPNVNPAFIRLADGVVLGSPAPADPALSAATTDIPVVALSTPGEGVSEADAAAALEAAEKAEQAAAAASPAPRAPSPDTAAPDDGGADAPADPANDTARGGTAEAGAGGAADDPGDGAVPAGGGR